MLNSPQFQLMSLHGIRPVKGRRVQSVEKLNGETGISEEGKFIGVKFKLDSIEVPLKTS